MAVTITPKPKNYFLQLDNEGRQMPISKLEMYGITAPQYVGNVIAKDYAPDSYFGWLNLTGATKVINSEQIRWSEEHLTDYPLSVGGAGVVTRDANVFTINNALIPADAFDIDLNRPTEAQWVLVEDQTILVVDANKVEQSGIVTSVSADGLTMTAVRTDANADWTVDTANLDVILTGKNLNHCECPSCIGYKDYVPQYENTMQKTGECYEYCEETEIAKGGYVYEPYTTREGSFKVDARIDEKLKKLAKETEQMVILGNRMNQTKATALGKPIGMKGVLEQIKDRALKIDQKITTLDDLRVIAGHMKKNGIKQAVIHATDEQYQTLVEIVPDNMTMTYDIFTDHQNDVMYFGVKGVNFNGTEILFANWSGLDYLSENLANKYNFIITPMDKLRKQVNGTEMEVNYVELFYFGTEGNVYNMKRVDNGQGNCGKFKHDYVTKLTVGVYHPERFILGINP